MKFVRRLFQELENIFVLTPVLWMAGSIGNRLRYLYYRRKLKYLGRGAVIDVGAQIVNPAYVSIGDNAWIDKFVVLIAGEPMGGRVTYVKPNPNYKGKPYEIHIGANCHIAPFVVISGHGGFWLGDNSGIASGSELYSFSHHFRDLTDRDNPRRDYFFTPKADFKDQSMISGAVVMEDETALGLNSVVLPGVTIGRGSWVGSASLVAEDIPPGVIASGNPAEVKKKK